MVWEGDAGQETGEAKAAAASTQASAMVTWGVKVIVGAVEQAAGEREHEPRHLSLTTLVARPRALPKA